VYTNVSRLSR